MNISDIVANIEKMKVEKDNLAELTNFLTGEFPAGLNHVNSPQLVDHVARDLHYRIQNMSDL